MKRGVTTRPIRNTQGKGEEQWPHLPKEPLKSDPYLRKETSDLIKRTISMKTDLTKSLIYNTQGKGEEWWPHSHLSR